MSAQCTDHCHPPPPAQTRATGAFCGSPCSSTPPCLWWSWAQGWFRLRLLLADAIDFLGDAANYGVSLLVLAMALRVARQGSAFLQGAKHAGLQGVCDWPGGLGRVAGHHARALTMGSVGLLALAANVGVALLLYAWRDGDANMRGVAVHPRNDALSNVWP